MYRLLVNFRYLIGSIRMIPHIIYYLMHKGSGFSLDLKVSAGKCGLWTFIVWMQKKRYMRNLFYRRAGKWFTFFFELLLPIDHTLHLYNCPLGIRCHLEHSQNTFLNAKSIGSDFYCLHNVTIGNNGSRGSNPRIGNNVKIYTGAVVIGDIQVGDNVIIAANAVVNKDIPANSLVAGVPAKIIRKIE